jgi:predicted RNA-binding protein associated with RNAse of E/G family
VYANILTPVEGVDGAAWKTTDLFLDVWLPAGGGPARLLDAAELAQAERDGALDRRHADRARSEAERLLRRAGRGDWPPPVVARWTLEAARRHASGGTRERGAV